MKNNRIELLALVFGAVAILISVVLFFNDGLKGYYKYVISVAFVLYIIYEWISTRNDHAQIQDLNNHVDNLKQEIGRKNDEISKLDSSLKKSQKENKNLQVNLSEKEKEVASLNDSLKSAQKEIAELKAEKKD